MLTRPSPKTAARDRSKKDPYAEKRRENASKLVNWVTAGVFDALEKGYLRQLGE